MHEFVDPFRLSLGLDYGENYLSALAFTNKIGDLAEEEGHHPSLLSEWGWVTVCW